MVFRCYSCGLHFSDGPPPLEALSPAQAELVGAAYQGDPSNILCDRLKDLSVYNFCSVCVVFARFQKVWEDDPEHKLVHAKRNRRLDRTENNRCSCGHEYEVPENRPTELRNEWIWINRAIHDHLFRVHYPNPPFDVDLLARV